MAKNGKKQKNVFRRCWNFIESIPDRYGQMCPPGFEYRSEINSNGILYGLGIGMSFPFLFQLKDAYDRLFITVRGIDVGQTGYVERIIPGAIAASFTELMKGYWWWFLPWIIAMFVNVIVHYSYYYRGTKSIYVMRRLANPYVTVKSCVQAPLVQLCMGLLIALALYFFDYGLYMWVMPGECNPRFW